MPALIDTHHHFLDPRAHYYPWLHDAGAPPHRYGDHSALKRPYLPADSWQRAQALSWMFFEQYSHEPYIAVARFICGWTPIDSPRRADLPRLRERGHEALAVMERHHRMPGLRATSMASRISPSSHTPASPTTAASVSSVTQPFATGWCA